LWLEDRGILFGILSHVVRYAPREVERSVTPVNQLRLTDSITERLPHNLPAKLIL